MTVRFHIPFVACLASFLGGAPRLSAQFDLYVAHVADGAGYFSQVSVYNPGSSAVTCTFTTFDDQGNLLDLVYASDPGAAAAFRRKHSGAKPAATAPESSVSIPVPAGGTTQVETSGDGKGNVLQGAAELNCSAFVIGGVTYWYTVGGDLVTGIGVPAANTTTEFRVDGGNEHTAFAIYNPSQANILNLNVEAYDDTGENQFGPVDLEIDPNGHYAFNANTVLTTLPSGFYGSFQLTTNGQQFVPLALGVATTAGNAGGFLLYTIASFSGVVVGL
jgi:hypothetical protein